MEEFGAFLKKKRINEGLSLKELCSKLANQKDNRQFLDKSVLSRWETCKREPHSQHRPILLSIAAILNMDESEKNDLLTKAGLSPLRPDELDIDALLRTLGTRQRQSWYLCKKMDWSEQRTAEKLKVPVWDIQRDIKEIEDEEANSKVTSKPETATIDIGYLVGEAKHLTELNNLIAGFRNCLFNNHIELVPDYRGGLLEFDDRDWRLEPLTWCNMVTPDIDEEDLWGEEYKILFSHLKGSPFEKHYYELFKKAHSLDTAYDQAAQKIGEKNLDFLQRWQTIRPKILANSNFINVPSLADSGWDEIRPVCTHDECEEIIDKISGVFPDVISHLIDLEKSLDLLNQDLKSKNIESVLQNGHCGECPSK